MQPNRAYINQTIRAGVAYALLNGTKTGRPFGHPPTVLPDSFEKYYQQCQAGQITKVEFARLLRKGRRTIYRWIELYKKGKAG